MSGLGDEDSNPPVDPTARGLPPQPTPRAVAALKTSAAASPSPSSSLFALGLSLPSLLLDFSVCFTPVALVSSPWWSNELRNLWSRPYI